MIKNEELESILEKIDLRNEGGSYIEKAVFEVDYYSGKLLKNNVTMQINVD